MVRSYTIWLFIFLTAKLYASGPEDRKDDFLVPVRVPLEVVPGQFETFIFELRNEYDHPLDYQVKVTKPENWVFLSEIRNVTIPPGQKKRVTFLIDIDRACEVGEKELIFAFRDSVHNIEVQEVIRTTVQNIHQLEINLLQKPSYLISGQHFEVVFMVKNKGNCVENVRVSSTHGVPDMESFSVEPNASVQVKVSREVKSDLQYSTFTSLDIILESEALESPRQERVGVKTYPSRTEKVDPYLRYPIRASLIYVGMKNTQPLHGGYQLEAEGQGAITRNGKHILNFKGRGPNRFSIARALNYDQYSLEYKYKIADSTSLELRIGDFAYNLSPLTEMYRFGRGVGVSFIRRKLEIGSFYNVPRFRAEIRQQAGSYLQYQFSPAWSVRASGMYKEFLDETKKALLASLQAFYKSENHDVALEWASGSTGSKGGHGLSLEASGRFKKFSYNSQSLYAGKNFPGYYINSLFSNSNIGYRTGSIGLNAGYSYNDANPTLDTIFTTAPYSQNWTMGITYYFNRYTRFSLNYILRSREDRFEPKKFHYNEKVVRYQLLSNTEAWNVMINGEYGTTQNLLLAGDNNTANTFNIRGRVEKTLFKQLSVGGFSQYLFTNRYNQELQSYLFYGGSLGYRFSPALSMRGSLRNNYLLEEYYTDRSLLDFELNGNYRQHSLSVRTSHALIRNTVNRTDFFINVKYTYLWDVPLAKNKNLYSLQGKLFGDAGTKVSGVVIHMAGKTIATDKNGFFEFNDLPEGIYYLYLDPATLDFGLISLPSTPLQVEIKSAGSNTVRIALVRCAQIEGRINFVYSDQRDKEQKLPSRIIKISNGEQEFLTYTKEDGQFRFEDLSPGTWTVRVVDSGEKNTWIIETNNISVKIAPGQTGKADFTIRQKPKQINFSNKTFQLKG